MNRMSGAIRSIEVGEYDVKNRLLTHSIRNPNWEQFLEAMKTLPDPAKRFAGLTITAGDGSWLLIDGSDGLFFPMYQRADGFQFQTLPDTTHDGDVTIICGGVLTTLPRAYLLDESATLRIAWEFWKGQLDVSTGWEAL